MNSTRQLVVMVLLATLIFSLMDQSEGVCPSRRRIYNRPLLHGEFHPQMVKLTAQFRGKQDLTWAIKLQARFRRNRKKNPSGKRHH